MDLASDDWLPFGDFDSLPQIFIATKPMKTANLSDLLTFICEQNASDLHLSANQPIMMRLHGKMTALPFDPPSHQAVTQMLFGVMTDEQQQAWQTNQELDFAIQTANARFRVNVFYQHTGAAAVFRHIKQRIATLDELNAPPILQKIATLTQGLVLVTGATGSGKSTTLAAIIDYINRHRHAHILTIEDPIEFVHHSQKSLINQRQVHQNTHSFANALKSALREDPDVILVGELRDLQTIRLALTAAETGHLVLATLHTNSAAKSIDRLIDVFDAGEKSMIRTMLAESLQAVIAQKLLPAVQGGRVAAYEILLATPAVRNLIRENKIHQLNSIIQTSGQIGMLSLENSLKSLQAQGKITDKTVQNTLLKFA